MTSATEQTMSRFTPGPYSVEKCPCGDERCQTYHLRPVGSFFQGSGFTKNDAHLMSATWDLLHVAVLIRDHFARIGNGQHEKLDHIAKLADMAVRKAVNAEDGTIDRWPTVSDQMLRHRYATAVDRSTRAETDDQVLADLTACDELSEALRARGIDPGEVIEAWRQEQRGDQA